MRASGQACRNARSAGTAQSISPNCSARRIAMDFGAPSLSKTPGRSGMPLPPLLASCFDFRCARGFPQHEWSDDQRIEWRSPETLYCIARAADDRLAARIERRVDQHRNAGELLERLQQIIVERVLAAIDRLHAGRAIDVAHGRDSFRLVLGHIENEQ